MNATEIKLKRERFKRRIELTILVITALTGLTGLAIGIIAVLK